MTKTCWLLTLLVAHSICPIVSAMNNDSLFFEQVTGIEEFFTDEMSTDRLEQLQQFIETPLSLNVASQEDMLSSGLFNDFQIFSILDYRQRYGDILSAGELSVLTGFDTTVVATLVPFISFEQPNEGQRFRKGHGQLHYTITLPASADTTWIGSPIGILVRGKLTPQQGVHAGFVAEKDPGEEWLSSGGGTDLSSGFLQLTSRNGRFTITGGDFQARFGQGLALWTGYVPYRSSTLAQNLYKPAGLSPNYSRNENGYLRGLALRFSCKRFHVSSYYSQRWRDAIIESDSSESYRTIRSIVVTGLHRTTAEISHTRATTDRLIGSYMGWQGRTFVIGLGAFGHYFGLPLSPKFTYPGITHHRDSYFTAHSDYLLIVGQHQLSGEVAYNPGGGAAMVHHFYTEIYRNVQYILSYHYHSPDYFSFFADGRNSLAPNNEADGLYQGLECQFPNLVTISVLTQVQRLVGDYSEGFKKGYNSDIFGTLTSRWRGAVSLHLKYRYQRVKDDSNGEQTSGGQKQSFRGDIVFRPSDYWWIRPRIDWRYNEQDVKLSEGWMVSAETGCRGRNWPWGVTVQWSRFRTTDFYSALYAWQTDVLYEIGFPANYGNGYRVAASFFYKTSNRWRLAFSYANQWKARTDELLAAPEEVGARLRGQVIFSW